MQENYYFFAILIKIRVPLFPCGMKGTKNFWNMQEKFANFSKLFDIAKKNTQFSWVMVPEWTLKSVAEGAFVMSAERCWRSVSVMKI